MRINSNHGAKYISIEIDTQGEVDSFLGLLHSVEITCSNTYWMAF